MADEQDEKDVAFVEEKLRSMKEKGLEPVGYLGIYSIEDYTYAPDIPLDMKNTRIDIGRYGPFSNKGTF